MHALNKLVNGARDNHEQFDTTKKTMNQRAKPPQKIRQVRKHVYNAKKQNSKQINEQKIAQEGYANVMQNTKIEQTKKLHHSFLNYTTKTADSNSDQNANIRYSCI